MSNKFSSIKIRVLELAEKKEVSKQVFFKKICMTYGNFTGKSKNTPLNSNAISNIVLNYPDVNLKWLITGNGSMLNDEFLSIANQPTCQHNIYPKKQENHLEKKYPLVDLYAIEGFGDANFNIEQKNIKDYYVIPAFKDRQVDFMIEVRGNSMAPIYSSSDIVACRIIKESNFTQWNEIHLIATKGQGILIKRLRKSKKETHIIAVSENINYEPIELPKAEITGIALVVGGVYLE